MRALFVKGGAPQGPVEGNLRSLQRSLLSPLLQHLHTLERALVPLIRSAALSEPFTARPPRSPPRPRPSPSESPAPTSTRADRTSIMSMPSSHEKSAPVHPAPVYQQPQAAPMMTHEAPPAHNAGAPGHERDWSTGLCACKNDCGGFCLAFWCPCIAYGQYKSRFDSLRFTGRPLPKEQVGESASERVLPSTHRRSFEVKTLAHQWLVSLPQRAAGQPASCTSRSTASPASAGSSTSWRAATFASATASRDPPLATAAPRVGACPAPRGSTTASCSSRRNSSGRPCSR